ncbi:hypothetical protein GGI11_005050 [Coemansia sp. RSA 2049]|nr:hypothetical protein GGI11_005050 [Coemansia sp. RSA 2049]
MEPVQKRIRVETFACHMLLDSFREHSSRDILKALRLRVKLGRLDERRASERPNDSMDPSSANTATMPSSTGSHEMDQPLATEYSGEFASVFSELSDLYSKIQRTISVIDLLSVYDKEDDWTGNIRIRYMIYKLLCVLFSDLFAPSKETGFLRPFRSRINSLVDDEACCRMRDLSLASCDTKIDSLGASYLWTLIRPKNRPWEVAQLFLMLSAQAAQLQRSNADPDAIVAVGPQWYTLLINLYVQLGLAAYEFGDWALKDVASVSKLFEPSTRYSNEQLSVLWNVRNKEDIESFDAKWMTIRELTKGLGNSRTAVRNAEAMYQHCSPHSFCAQLCVYLTAVLDFLEPPTLDFYTSIRQAGNMPYGFFNTPNQVVSTDLPSLQLETTDESHVVEDAELMLLDPFSPRANSSVLNLSTRDVDVCQSPSERVAQAHAYNSISNKSKKAPGSPLAPLSQHGVGSDSHENKASQQQSESVAYTRMAESPKLASRDMLPLDGDYSASDESDIEMSPSQHASAKRQRSDDNVLSPSDQITPRRSRHNRLDSDRMDSIGMDIDNSALLESPSAMLSAKHDRRVKTSVLLHTQAPPALNFGSAKTPNSPPEAHVSPANSSAMTTPKSQTGEKMGDIPKYIADRTYGDVEGGGRPHRRRHNTGAFGTPKAMRPTSLEPPPQTILSPSNIAAAQRNNIELKSLIAQREYHDTADSMMGLERTPQRTRSTAEMLEEPQTTPENQIGHAADAAGAVSASRYVSYKEQGDITGGGRRHNNRQRGGVYDSLLYMGS